MKLIIATATTVILGLASLADASFFGADQIFPNILEVRPLCPVQDPWIPGVDEVPIVPVGGIPVSTPEISTSDMPITSHQSTGTRMAQLFITIAPSTSTTSGAPPLQTDVSWTDWMCCNLDCDVCYSGADCDEANKNADCNEPVTRDYPICCKVKHTDNGEKEKLTKPDGATEVSLVYG
ncbi:hypothetical protein B0T19DRAFT_397650 [Cercophora scortea]|uniref:Uncharacterized protein n=1 Tax=Cercophora scortea TaxID=314031 RepID=A0AAE0IVP9_9PEZI|nr:hypothetical protein B0T19DRAFT_397650 [Cercophora scortea]